MAKRLNLVQQMLIARSAVRSIPDADDYERWARRRHTVLKYLMLALIVGAAIDTFKFYF